MSEDAEIARYTGATRYHEMVVHEVLAGKGYTITLLGSRERQFTLSDEQAVELARAILARQQQHQGRQDE